MRRLFPAAISPVKKEPKLCCHLRTNKKSHTDSHIIKQKKQAASCIATNRLFFYINLGAYTDVRTLDLQIRSQYL